eukprot:CAMPEP_0115752746 /NCGR_PEP_ID=MMETSP0272-20121206/95958_1 /TAXON_ID=71861 /ORGANISM="Scrippsiella trochoidea, Strain CCMP3099" /LENGTH=134 /DNA_ID=CAMNT_0003198021 /DNA_START=111 /DNA_END=516 /DNA_ORIENTATION=-
MVRASRPAVPKTQERQLRCAFKLKAPGPGTEEACCLRAPTLGGASAAGEGLGLPDCFYHKKRHHQRSPQLQHPPLSPTRSNVLELLDCRKPLMRQPSWRGQKRRRGRGCPAAPPPYRLRGLVPKLHLLACLFHA